MAYVVMAYVVMAYIVMAQEENAKRLKTIIIYIIIKNYSKFNQNVKE